MHILDSLLLHFLLWAGLSGDIRTLWNGCVASYCTPDKMTCQALGSSCFQVVGQLHTAMNQVGQSQTVMNSNLFLVSL